MPSSHCHPSCRVGVYRMRRNVRILPISWWQNHLVTCKGAFQWPSFAVFRRRERLLQYCDRKSVNRVNRRLKRVGYDAERMAYDQYGQHYKWQARGHFPPNNCCRMHEKQPYCTWYGIWESYERPIMGAGRITHSRATRNTPT